MIMIRSHLIASQPLTKIYSLPTVDSIPVGIAAKGSWLGEVRRDGDWIQVIGIECEGWVMKSEVEVLPPLGLHAVWRPGKPIAYMHLSNAS